MTAARGKPLSKRAAKAAARALAAAENAELTRLLEASENQQNAVAANAVAHAEAQEAQEAAAQEPHHPVPGYSIDALRELVLYPQLQRAEREQGRRLLPFIEPNRGPRTFTPEQLREMELVGFPRWAAEQNAKRGGRRTRRKGRSRRSRR